MRGAERIYRILLRLYPGRFRREYGEPMLQAFRDLWREAASPAQRRRVWARTAFDLWQTAREEQMTELRTNLMAASAWLFGLLAAIYLGRLELHTDDAGIEVLFILVFTFILGCWYPKRAWLAPLVALSIPVAELIWGRPRAELNHAAGLAMLAGFVVAVGLAGSFAGVLIRKLLRA